MNPNPRIHRLVRLALPSTIAIGLLSSFGPLGCDADDDPTVDAESETPPPPTEDITAQADLPPSPTPPQATMEATVEGELDKDLIRRIVRAHISEIRTCYTELLSRQPDAAGRIEARFRIDTSGDVIDVAISATSIDDEAFLGCTEDAVGGWLFPKPRHGSVLVTYPFLFEPG